MFNVLFAVPKKNQTFCVQPKPIIFDLSNYHFRPRQRSRLGSLGDLDRGSLGAALGLARTICGAT